MNVYTKDGSITSSSLNANEKLRLIENINLDELFDSDQEFAKLLRKVFDLFLDIVAFSGSSVLTSVEFDEVFQLLIRQQLGS